MQGLDWTDYFAVAIGLIGAVTGIVGAPLGLLGYRKANSLKRLDLRLELRKSVNELHQALLELSQLVARADLSRMQAAGALGRTRGDIVESWRRGVKADKEWILRQQENAPAPTDEFAGLSPEKLEEMLVEVHQLKNSVKNRRNGYESAMKADETELERFHRRV